jgi:hypothetical protein
MDRNDKRPQLLLESNGASGRDNMMTIQTSDEYQAAIERLKELGEKPADGPDQDEFFEINAAMVDYETRNHPALTREMASDRD